MLWSTQSELQQYVERGRSVGRSHTMIYNTIEYLGLTLVGAGFSDSFVPSQATTIRICSHFIVGVHSDKLGKTREATRKHGAWNAEGRRCSVMIVITIVRYRLSGITLPNARLLSAFSAVAVA